MADATSLSSLPTTRREFLRQSLFTAVAASLGVSRGNAAEAATTYRRPGITREIFLPSPRTGTTVFAGSYYTRKSGLDLISVHELMTRSDTIDVSYFRYSNDNGRTWTAGEEFPTFGLRPTGKLRRANRGLVLDPFTGRLIHFYLEAILPTDDPLEGFRQWMVYYRISEDGGMTWYANDELIQKGPGFDADHPLPGVRRGHTGTMIGDPACRPIFLPDGTLLVPLIIAPAGPDGNYVNPGGGYTYSDAAVARGRWGADGRHFEWELSALAKGDPELTTRGMDEPTLGVLSDGRILMIMRGSNDKKPELPGRRWVSYSSDQARTWTKPVPWTYSSGENFFSPAVSSQLFTHSSGRLFWFGVITAENTRGNRPRYPLVMAEVNRKSGLLEKASIRVIDDRGPNETVSLQLSSPSTREDRETSEIVMNLTRFSEFSPDENHDWTANAYLYHIKPD